MQQLGRVLKDRAHGRLLGAAVRIFHGSVQAPRVPGEGLSPIRCPHVTTCAALSCLSQLPAQLSVACCVLQWRGSFGGIFLEVASHASLCQVLLLLLLFPGGRQAVALLAAAG